MFYSQCNAGCIGSQLTITLQAAKEGHCPAEPVETTTDVVYHVQIQCGQQQWVGEEGGAPHLENIEHLQLRKREGREFHYNYQTL